MAIGNPAGLEGTVSKGIISGIRKAGEMKLIQITAPISPGSSGGPVFNLSGKVIGIATAYLDLGQNLNFAMPVNYLKTLRQANLKLSSLPKTQKRPDDIDKNKTLLEIFNVHDSTSSSPQGGTLTLFALDFSIMNRSTYRVSNIQLVFVYRNYKNEVISYSAESFRKTILPRLALQFEHVFTVKHFDTWDDRNKKYLRKS